MANSIATGIYLFSTKMHLGSSSAAEEQVGRLVVHQ
jgi:hypothetical protein